eukprot:s995_g29.t1
MQFERCSIHPCLARSKDSVILFHVDDIVYVGNQSHWELFKEKLQQRFTISFSVLGGVGSGSEVSFLKRKIVNLDEGLALVSWNSISKLVNAFEMKFRKVRVSSMPADQGLQMVDNSLMLAAQDASFYRMAVGVCLYLARDRPDVAFTIKELSSFMSSPTVNSSKHLRRLVGVISLSSCEPELHGMISTLCDGIFIKRCAEFVGSCTIERILFTDSSSARQLASRQGIGRVKHLDAKVLWIQDHVREDRICLSQVGTQWNIADIGTKVLTAKRLKCLLDEIGVKDDGGHSQINAEEHGHAVGHVGNRQMKQAVRTIARLAILLGLGPTGAMGFLHGAHADDPTCDPAPVEDEPHSNLV